MDNKKNLIINLSASGISFIVNLGISFFLTPYITETIGVEAYGFISLGNNFINYASLVTIALNSMAGRYITIEIHRGNWDAANKYFNSVFIANIIAAVLMLFPAVLSIVYIDRIVNVPIELLNDVRLLFTFLFINLLVSIIFSTFGVATFATNKLYLQSLRNIEGTILRAVFLLGLFAFLKPAVSFLGLSASIMLLYVTSFNYYYTKKLLPEIRLKRSYFDFKSLKELVLSGVWNTILRVGQLLLDGVDLLIANLFISSAAMGTLSLAKTVPTVIVSLVSLVAGVFMPDFTILYAKNKSEELVVSIKQSMNILGIIVNIPIAILASFGLDFFKLWVPTQNPRELQILSVITISTLIVSGSINSIYNVFTVTNRLRANAMVVLLTGVINVGIVFVVVNTTDLGVYAIAGISTVLSIIRNLAFTAPYGAKFLGLKWNTFFPEITKSVIAFIVVAIIGLGINYFVDIDSWILFFACAGITTILGLTVNLLVILKKSDRQYLMNKIKRKSR